MAGLINKLVLLPCRR